MVYEDVPRMGRRVGDNLIAGANNATILLGRDRQGSVDSGYGSLNDSGKGEGAGAIHLIVGRTGEDPSVETDKATVYLSAKTDPDSLARTEQIGTNRTAQSGIVLRADCTRISSRTDFKVSVGRAYLTMDSSGVVTIEGDISLGEGAAQRIIRGEAFSSFWNTVTVPTPMGPSGPPPPLPAAVFSARNKVK
jgi:hypothetical protein